ncbi:MAG: aminoacyl-tRNA hydrolase [Deltaproteobacteria bacterium]|nr:aminoacyl-tRNA hydrolase [Deltaproteobacteria bacterium]
MAALPLLVVGLGNPGTEYEKTRHNAGFLVLDQLAHENKLGSWRQKFQAKFVQWVHDGKKVYLIKPQTFMNLSGKAVAAWLQFLKFEPKDLLVVHDDVDLPLGKIKLAFNRSAAGHNGVQSIVEALNSQEFNRLRIGVGRPAHRNQDTADYVLKPFDTHEVKVLQTTLQTSLAALLHFIEKGLDSSMQMYNTSPSSSQP